MACAATYLRDVYVPAAVRVRVTNSLPSWVNDTVLSNIPALDVQMLERPVAARRGPGVRVRERGLGAKHPVVIVPGFVSTGLELWRGKACGASYFRRRMWGTPAMARAFLATKSVGWST